MGERKKKGVAASATDEFAVLVAQLAIKRNRGVPKAMTPVGLEVLAFDLEERDRLARIQAWVKSEGMAEARGEKATPSKTEESSEKKLTTAQEAMEARIRKQQSKAESPERADVSKVKKGKKMRAPLKKGK